MQGSLFGRLLETALCVGAGILILSTSASGERLGGRVYGDLYIFETDSSSHVQPYLGLQSRLNLLQTSDGQTLCFRSNLRWRTDLADDIERQADLFVYEAFLEFEHRLRRLTVAGGRQFRYTPAGSALLDGGYVRFRPVRQLRVELFAGAEVDRITPDRVQSLAEDLAAGGRLSALPAPDIRMSLNYMRREADDAVIHHRLSLDAAYSPQRWRFYGRIGYNMQQSDLAEMLARISRSFNRWYLSAELLYREPSVSGNSVFSIIDFDRYRQLRVEVRRRVWRSFDLFSRNHVTFFDNDESYSGSLGIGNGVLSLAWVHQDGNSGRSDGIDGFAYLDLGPGWSLYGHARLARYQVQEELDERSDAYSAAAGVSRSLAQGFDVQAEVQYLRNAVSTSDVRTLLRLTKNFSLGEEE